MLNYTVDSFYHAIELNEVDLAIAHKLISKADVDPLILVMAKNIIIEDIFKSNMSEAESLLVNNFNTLLPLVDTALPCNNALHLFLFMWCQSLRIQLMYEQSDTYTGQVILEACRQFEFSHQVWESKKALNFVMIGFHIQAMLLSKSELYNEALTVYLKMYTQAVKCHMPYWCNLIIEPILLNAIFVLKDQYLKKYSHLKIKESLRTIDIYLLKVPSDIVIYRKYIQCLTKSSTYNFFKQTYDTHALEVLAQLCSVNALPIDLILQKQIPHVNS